MAGWRPIKKREFIRKLRSWGFSAHFAEHVTNFSLSISIAKRFPRTLSIQCRN
jgi:hypothetical protein